MKRLLSAVITIVAMATIASAAAGADSGGDHETYELRLVKDIAPGTSNSEVNVESGVWIGGGMLFRARDKHSSELWRTDGSPSGTRLLEDTNPRGEGRPQNFTRLGRKVVFSAWGPRSRSGSLWLTDGTPRGTRHLTSISDGGGGVSQFVGTGALVFFVHQDGAERALWRTDGTPEGTFAITSHLDRRYRPLGAVGGRLVYVESEDGQARVMSSDGRVGESVELAGIDSWRAASSGHQLIFSGVEPETSRALTYITDGTPAGTSVLRDPAGYSPFLCFSYCETVSAGKRIYFTESRSDRPDRIWSIDALGRLRIFWNEGEGNDGIGSLVNTKAGLFFATFESDSEGTLWQSDRTRAGTAPLPRGLFGTAGQPLRFTDLVPLGAGVAAEVRNLEPNDSDGFWVTDGSEGGTSRVASPDEVSGASNSLLVSRGPIAFLELSDSAHGEELWRIAPAE